LLYNTISYKVTCYSLVFIRHAGEL